MANDLIQINTLAWKELELATITPESGFRYINLRGGPTCLNN